MDTMKTPQSELEEGAKEARRILNERRERPRTNSTLTKVEDITYNVLRQREQEEKNADNLEEGRDGNL